ncbi:MAG TPA: hypothetical protein VHD15_04285 [Hyphomicrobiales bacterium]|nr:hypothetical protein [Hyphomicrobiales bacterium]
MDIDLARHVVRATFASCHQVGDLLPLLKGHLPPDCGGDMRETPGRFGE